MRTMRRSLFAALCLLSLTGCELEICPSDDAETEGAVASPIIGGSVDAQNRSTVALLSTKPSGSRSICSGTVIATEGKRGWVLTAAHCVVGTVDHVYDATDWRDCTQAGDASKCNAKYAPVSWIAHPGYDAETFANDFAIVVFEGATASTPVTPAVEADDGLAVGTFIDISGYGRTYAGANNPDPNAFNYLRNHVVVPVAMLSDAWVGIDATTGETACFGDSGGPAYAHVGGKLRVVGVASNADQNCALGAAYGRVADVYDSFIAPKLPAPPSSGEGGSGEGGSGEGGSAQGGEGAGAGPGAGGSDGSGGDASNGSGGAEDPGTDPDLELECIPVRVTCSATRAGDAGTPGALALLGLAAAVLVGRRRTRRAS